MIALFIILSGLIATSSQNSSNQAPATMETGNQITQVEMIAKQKSWGDAIVLIGDAYKNGEEALSYFMTGREKEDHRFVLNISSFNTQTANFTY